MKFSPLALVVWLLTAGPLWGQTWDGGSEQVVVAEVSDYTLKIRLVISDPDGKAVWSTEAAKAILPSRPVGFKIKGENFDLKSSYTFIPKTETEFLLVAKAEVWIDDGKNGRAYQSTVQSIPSIIAEKVIFLPLGDKTPEAGDHVLSLELTIEKKLPEKTDS